jgi:PST family polysaccharide transporter
MQGTNYLVPIILIPIVIRRLSLETYGAIVLAQSIMVLFISFSDFGFNMTGTRLVSQSRDDSIQRRSLIGQILSIKIFNLILGFVLLYICVTNIANWYQYKSIVLTSYAMVIGQGLFPVWYFQGIQQMSRILILNTVSRIIYLLGVLVFVIEPIDALKVNLINGSAWILVSLIAWFVIIGKEGSIRLSFGNKTIRLFISNWKIFLSNLSGDLYRSIGMILAGNFLSGQDLGVFGIFDKIVMLIQNGFVAVFRGIFPQVSSSVADNPSSISAVYRGYFLNFGLVTILGMVGIVLFGNNLIQLISEEMSFNLQKYMWLLSAIPLFFLFNLPFSINLVAFDKKTHYLIYNLTTSICFIICTYILVPGFEIQGLLASHCISLFVTLILGFYLNRSLKLPLAV